MNNWYFDSKLASERQKELLKSSEIHRLSRLVKRNKRIRRRIVRKKFLLQIKESVGITLIRIGTRLEKLGNRLNKSGFDQSKIHSTPVSRN